MLTRVGSSSDVPVDGEMRVFDLDGTKVAVASVGDAVYAFDDACTHRGCSLGTGTLDAARVTCPCHHSQFDVTTGAVVRGPATHAVRARQVNVTDDDLLVDA